MSGRILAILHVPFIVRSNQPALWESRMSNTERIVCAALEHNGLHISLGPGRSHDVIRKMLGNIDCHWPTEDGFLTTRGHFVDRAAGTEIAIAAGQVTRALLAANGETYINSDYIR